MLTYFTAILLGVGVASGNICCFPKQYSAVQGLARSSLHGSHLSVTYGNLVYYFDAISRQETFIESLTVDGVDTKVTVIKDYNVTNTKYVITESGHCTHKSLTPFKEGCIPDWAKKLTDGYYGTAGSGTTFSVYDNSGGGATSFLIATPGQECVPILDISVIPSGSAASMQVVQFYNFTEGIQDRSVFDIPASCHASSAIG